MPSYKVLIFDFDGTLCHTKDSILYSFNKTFSQHKAVAPTEQEIMQAVSTGGSLPEILPILHPSLTPQVLMNWVQTYRHIYSTEAGHYTTLFEGTEFVLEAARKAGIRNVVISNKGQRAIEEALVHFNIASYFDLVIGDNPEVPLKKKPHPMAFLEVVAPNYPDISKDEFLMVGDTHIDLAFGNNARIDACWAQYGYGNPTLCLQEAPAHTVQNMAELHALLVADNH
ncbi:HAD family hydrolase [Nibribacter koreensis]|uniref:phosphoglycolate phosphatase n=1 Tax=Nibribacter koreensis TaxID=1084519 RepID=A0ABP8G375_9BACT